jgi:hypothetical protein
MTIAQLIPLAINVSMVLIIFALGLSATVADTASLSRRAGLLARMHAAAVRL